MFETIIAVLFGLVLSAYGWIFKTIIDRIKINEKNHCDLDNKVSEELKELRTNNSAVFTELKTKLASIETNICWIKKDLLKKK